MKQRVNEPCNCGSGKKYKKCCKLKDDAATAGQRVFEMARRGELQPFVRISSSNAGSAGISIQKMSTVQNGRRTDYIGKETSLQTNSVDGDKSEVASAQIHFMSHGKAVGRVFTSGNATVCAGEQRKIPVLNSSKKNMRADSESGLFAIASVKIQRSTDQKYFDLIFGVAGQKTELDKSGQKNRPHLSFHPDGNGKFIRLASDLCELESESVYATSAEQSVIPKKVTVRLLEHDETLELMFRLQGDAEIMLYAMKFKNS